jgi:hypothetical protein
MTKTHSMFTVLVVIAVLLAANLFIITSESKAVAEAAPAPAPSQQTAGLGVCPSDIDGDGEVGILDFLMLLGDWGPCPPGCGDPTAGNCCGSNDSPYCNDFDCCVLVCSSFDPFCCDAEWDALCAAEAVESCSICQ